MSGDSSSGLGSDQPSTGVRRPKILSSIGSTKSSSRHQADGDSRPPDYYDNIDTRDTVDKGDSNDPFKKPEAVQRSKRLFGALMGHLGVAKRKLEEDHSNIERISAVQMAVSRKNGMENRRLLQLQREASDSHKAKEKALREIFKLRLRKTDIATSSAVWREKVMAPRLVVLMTRTLPRLCWLPTAHNIATKNMLDKRSGEVAAEISERDEQDAQSVQQIDKELASLQAYVSTFVDQPSASEGDNVEVSSSSEMTATAGMTSSELSEYMTRVNRSRTATSGDSESLGDFDADSAANRRNWGIDQGHGPIDRNAEKFPMSYTSSGKRQSENISVEDVRNMRTARHQHNGQSIESGQYGSHLGSSAGEGGRRRGGSEAEEGEQGEEGEEGEVKSRDHGKGSGNNRNRDDGSRKNASYGGSSRSRTAEVAVVDEEYNPDEAVDEDEAEGDEEEDEAEQLLAALGGRKH